MQRVIVPFSLGGSLYRGDLCPKVKAEHMTHEGMKALIDNYRLRYGRVDEIGFFHGGTPSDTQLSICQEIPWRVSQHPLDCTRVEAKRYVKAGIQTIELEVHSLCDDVLRSSKKGYTLHYIQQQTSFFHQQNVSLGFVLSPGMYGSSYHHMCETVERCIELAISFVRIYPICIYEGTKLEKRYKEGRFTPLTLSQTVTIVQEMCDRLLRAGIDVIRIGRQGQQDGLENPIAGPIHSNIRSLIENRRFFDIIAAQLCATDSDVRYIKINPKDISLVKGVGGDTIRHLRARLERELVIICDEEVPRGTVQTGSSND